MTEVQTWIDGVIWLLLIAGWVVAMLVVSVIVGGAFALADRRQRRRGLEATLRRHGFGSVPMVWCARGRHRVVPALAAWTPDRGWVCVDCDSVPPGRPGRFWTGVDLASGQDRSVVVSGPRDAA